MTSRRKYIERILRQISGGQPNDDSQFTYNLINEWLNDATAIAAKQNYVESIKMDGIVYNNSSFSITFSGISILSDDTNNLGYKLSLPQIPLGLGKNEGINTLRFKDDGDFISQSVIWLSANQVGYAAQMRQVPNKIYAYNEGEVVRFTSTLPLYQYTAVVSMVSGGNSSNLDSNINLPDDWFPMISEYIGKMLITERSQPLDLANDSIDKA